MDPSSHYPQYIEDLLSELHSGRDPTETLLSYVEFLPADNTLYLIYNRLGYAPEQNSFTRVPTRRQITSEIARKFSDAAAPADSPVKEEFLRTFCGIGCEQLSTPAELGLLGPEPALSGLRPNKGLKFLSIKLKEVICRKGYISYKKVADELVSELILQENPESERAGKNVLRRVYDALNVLIAVGAIVKTNREYCWQGLSASSKVDFLAGRHDLLIRRRKENSVKRENLRKVASRFYGLKELIRRNQEPRAESDIIQLPLIVIATEETPKNNIKIEFNRANTHVCVKLSKEINIVEDTDLLVKLNLHQRCSEVPHELVKILNFPAHDSLNRILFR